MLLIPLKTPLIQPGQELFPVLQRAVNDASESLQEKDIVILASKIVAYSQGRLVEVKDKEEFRELVKQEADQIVDEGNDAMTMVLTLKENVLIPNAGIDSSNTPQGQVVLWPKRSFEFAQQFRRQLMKQYHLNELGVLVTDSHCQPLRQGTSGIALGWAGFQGVQDERGAEDLFGQKMQYTQIAVADNLASAALLEMGETNASIPFVIARNVPVEFTDRNFTSLDAAIAPEECLYRPMYGGMFKIDEQRMDDF